MDSTVAAASQPTVFGRRISWGRGDRLAVVLWAGLVVAALAWGVLLIEGGADLGLHAPPLFGHVQLRIGFGTLLPIGFAAAVIASAPAIARRASFGWLCAAASLGTIGWAVSLAIATGASGLTDPVTNPNEYLPDIGLVHSAGDFLSHFTARIDLYSTHVRGHPPGMILILFGLDRIGLGGAGVAAGLIIAVAGSGMAAALIALRSVAGESAARRAAPFLVLAPAAIWIATSADALYMGVSAWAVALIVLALTAHGRRSTTLAASGGLLFGICLFLSFGLTLLAMLPLAVAIAVRRLMPLIVAGVAALAVIAAVAAAGYWWLDGYQTVREQYAASIARSRPYGFFLFSDLAAFALALGPAAAVALRRLRDRRVWLLAGGGLAAVVLADLSGMSKAEVERIWLPFVPWVLLATAAIDDAITRRTLLIAQAGCAIVIQTVVVTGW